MSLKKIGRNQNDDDEMTVDEAVSGEMHFADEEHEYEMFAGYTDANGTNHKTYTLREMTGKDQEAIGRNSEKQPAKIMNMLLTLCVTSIGTITPKDVGLKKWGEIIQSLLSGDQDSMLMELRKLSHGNEMTFVNVCPYCKTKLTTVLNTDELEVKPFNGSVKVPFELPKGYVDKKGVVHKTGTMRLPNGLDREIMTPIAKVNMAKANTLMLTRLCKFDDGAYIDEDIVRNLTVRDREYLQNVLDENLFGISFQRDIDCDSCGNTFNATLNTTNFI